MRKKGPTLFPLAPAHFVWLGAMQTYAVLLFFDATLAVIPLLVFLVITFTAPFLPTFPYFLPIVSRGAEKGASVALTFDDGPDPETTPLLLDLLDRHKVKAAFFVTGSRAEKYPELMRSIIEKGHEVGNHSFAHDPLLMLRSSAVLKKEIEMAQEVLAGMGVVPRAFRPPVGIVTPRLWPLLLEQGMYCMNFSVRPRDFGNRRLTGLSRRVLDRVKNGDIVLLHDSSPGENFNADLWLSEIDAVIRGIQAQGLELIKASSLTGKAVHVKKVNHSGNSIESFYDSLAQTYDSEQLDSGVSLIRKKELFLFNQIKSSLFTPEKNVLELGAGTGLFTLEIASMVREITAVDISGDMLSLLKSKAEEQNRTNINYVITDMENFDTEQRFDVICSFSSLEYAADIEGYMQRTGSLLKPGGVLYVTTAHRSFLRFFAQLGNAMRQGIWLHARSRRKILRICSGAGLRVCFVKSHVFSIPFLGGLIVEFKAVKETGGNI